MKAMILAAGLGTRLRPLTDDRPKALVELPGRALPRRTLLEIALRRLRAAGVDEAIVNTHHHAAMISNYLAANHNFGMKIETSPEETLLDTGGGLKKAAWFFLDSGGNGDDPFILHNVDVISGIDLARMVCFHSEQGALATLAVQEREASRYLVFDENGQLCGRRSGRAAASGAETDETLTELVRPARVAQRLGFCGVHVISPRIFAKLEEEGAFPIVAAYLRLAAQGEKIAAFRADGSYWRDLGRPESLVAAERDFDSGAWSGS